MRAVWKGWLAGILDGEGCLNIYPANKANYAPRISIANTDRRMLEHVRELLGYGTISKSTGAGARKTCYTWFCENSGEILHTLAVVWPYLIIKKEQARILDDFCATVEPHTTTPPAVLAQRKQLMEQIKNLNSKRQRRSHQTVKEGR